MSEGLLAWGLAVRVSVNVCECEWTHAVVCVGVHVHMNISVGLIRGVEKSCREMDLDCGCWI